MDSKKVIGGLVLGIASVLVLGFILVFVVFGNNSGSDLEPTETSGQTENTAADETVYEESQTETLEEPTENTEDTEEVTEDVTSDTSVEETTEEHLQQTADTQEQTQNVEESSSVYGEWSPAKVADGFSGEEISFNEAFGNDFYQHENYLKLSDDGSFELALGTMKTEEEGKGSFSLAGDALEITYGDGSQDIFKLEKDSTGNVMFILVPRYNFTVYFQRQ